MGKIAIKEINDFIKRCDYNLCNGECDYYFATIAKTY